MVVLMGGRYSQGYQLFQQLTVKAFLAIRPYADQLVSTVQLMLDTSLPSFKGEPTIRRLKERFALGMNERQAAEWMMAIVRNAHENVRSTAYDEFQRVSVALLFLRPALNCMVSFKMVCQHALCTLMISEFSVLMNVSRYSLQVTTVNARYCISIRGYCLVVLYVMHFHSAMPA